MRLFDRLESRRHLSAGAIDTGYGGGDGTVDVRINARAAWAPSATDANVDAAGRAIVAAVYGGKRNQFSVARLTADGAADATFGANGIAAFALPSNRSGDVDVVADRRGRTLVMISTDRGVTVTRLTETGAADKKFGKNGTAVVPFVTSAADLTVDAGNNVVAIGTTPGKAGTRAAVVRLTYRGKLDATFAGGGVFKSPLPRAGEFGMRPTSGDYEDEFRFYPGATGQALQVLADGGIAAVASVRAREENYHEQDLNDLREAFGVWALRLTADGAVDRTYASGGRAVAFDTSDGDIASYAGSPTFQTFTPEGGVVVKYVSDYLPYLQNQEDETQPDQFLTDWVILGDDGRRDVGDAAPNRADAPAVPGGNRDDGSDRARANVLAVQPDGRWLVDDGGTLRRVAPGQLLDEGDATPAAAVDATFGPTSTPANGGFFIVGSRAMAFGLTFGRSTLRVTAIALR